MEFSFQDHNLYWILLLFTLTVVYQWRQQHRLSNTIPWAGGSKIPFSSHFVRLKVLLRGRALLDESYKKYSKANKPYMLPSIFGSYIVLPPSLVPWLIDQPDSVLSALDAQIDAVEFTHTMLRPKIVLQPTHTTILRRELKNHLNELAPDIQDEISHAFDEIWGLETRSYTMINLDKTIREIVTRASNRAFVGYPLCRDPTFVQNIIRYVVSIPMGALLIKLFPRFSRSFLARFLTLRTQKCYSRCAHHLEHHFANRISAWREDPAVMQNNFADWAVCDAMGRDDPVEKTPDMLSRRLMAVNFAAIHTSTMTMANMILDVASGSAGEQCRTAVFTECQALTQRYGTQWSSRRIAEMVITDSALRESMRISGFGSQAFMRKVRAQNGIVLPSGTHVSHGKKLCVSGYSMHHDESIYAKPYEFCYDRFLQPLADSKGSHQQAVTQVKSAATTDVNYGVWGHGRHACPGRFFAVHLVKMVIAYIVQNYELKPWNERPANSWIGDTPIPPRNLMISVRRR